MGHVSLCVLILRESQMVFWWRRIFRGATSTVFFENVMWYGHSGASMQSDIIISKTFWSFFRSSITLYWDFMEHTEKFFLMWPNNIDSGPNLLLDYLHRRSLEFLIIYLAWSALFVMFCEDGRKLDNGRLWPKAAILLS